MLDGKLILVVAVPAVVFDDVMIAVELEAVKKGETATGS